MAQGATPDVRLRELLHPDRRHHPCFHAGPFERVLQSQGIDHGRQHAHVVGGHPIHTLLAGHRPPHDVATADDQAEADARRLNLADLAGQLLNDSRLDAEPPVSGERLSGDLHERSRIEEL